MTSGPFFDMFELSTLAYQIIRQDRIVCRMAFFPPPNEVFPPFLKISKHGFLIQTLLAGFDFLQKRIRFVAESPCRSALRLLKYKVSLYALSKCLMTRGFSGEGIEKILLHTKHLQWNISMNFYNSPWYSDQCSRLSRLMLGFNSRWGKSLN